MNFCEHCGGKLEENSLLCEHCGEKVDNVDPAASEKEEPLATKNVERKPLTKKQKTIGAGIIALLLLLFIGYNVGSTVHSQENQTSQITEALVAKDADKLADVTTTDDPNLEVNAENLEGFVRYLDQNPNYLNELVAGLERTGRHGPFVIRQNGSRFGLFDAYELVMQPVYGTVSTNTEDVSISLGDEELLVSNDDSYSGQVGPFVPGLLTFTASGMMNEFPITVEHEVEWLDGDYNEVDLSLTGLHFSVISELENATVYVNGESIGELENGRGEFGPIPFEEGMELHVAQTFGEDEVVSDPIELSETENYYEFNDLVVGDDYDVQQVLSNMYRQVYNLTRNYNEDNVSDLNTYFHPEGPAYEDQRTSFTSFGESTYNNEDVNSVRYNITELEVERVGANSFDVAYEVTYTTNYNYSVGRDNQIQHYGKEATVMFEPTNHPNREYDSLIYEIRNEELLYEEGADTSPELEESDESEEATAEMGGDDQISRVVTSFVTNLPNAVNNNDFSLISEYIDSSSSFYEEQASFVSSTHERGITERLDNVEVLDVTVDGDTIQVRTSETFTIFNDGSENQSTYEATYDLALLDGNYLITSLAID